MIYTVAAIATVQYKRDISTVCICAVSTCATVDMILGLAASTRISSFPRVARLEDGPRRLETDIYHKKEDDY